MRAKLKPVSKRDYRCEFYRIQLKELKEEKIEIYNWKKIKSILRWYQNDEVLNYCFGNINENLIFGSYIHGVNHNLRVLLHSIILCYLLNVDRESLKVMVYAAMYHDIGRINDVEDKSHGKRSADKINGLDIDISEEQKNILKTIVCCHSLPDEEFDDVCKEYGVKNRGLCRTLFDVLKDSDALDRVRLEYPYIKLDLLRTGYSLSLVKFAYELCCNFNSII